MIAVGTVLQDRYEVTRLLAQGGMADVFAAHDRVLERTVAIKVVRGTTVDQRQRLEREARLLAGFEHPNLVRVYDAQHDRDDAYVVLEYVDGPTLADVIRDGPLPSARAALIGAEVADALAYIHARGVIHRDVKPSNVFVGSDGRARLSDFGVARHDDDAQLTQTGMVVGTGAYMAPEQVEGGVVGPPADVYALGLVLLECLTAARAYTGTAGEAAVARLSRDPDLSSVPPRWASLLGAMTARAASSRPDASGCAAQLRALPLAVSDDTQVFTAPLTAVTPVPTNTEPGRARRLSVLAAILMLLALLAAFALTRGGDGPASTDNTTTTVATVTTKPSTTTSTRPTSTTSRCANLRAQRNALDDQERALADTLKGKALHDAQKALEESKQSLDEQLKSCDD